MRLEKTAVIGEIVSSVAIVITLAYLAVQTSQTNIALRADSRQAAMETEVSILMGLLDHPEAIVSEVDPEGLWKKRQVFAALARLREFNCCQYRNGILDDAIWESYANTIARLFRDEYGREFWGGLAGELDADFYAYMTTLIDSR